MFTITFRDKEELGVESVIVQLRRLAGTSDLLICDRALLGLTFSVSSNNEHILPVENCIMRVPTSHETAGIGPFARFCVESTDCLLVLTRVSTKQVKRVAHVNDRGVTNISGVTLYRGWTQQLKEIIKQVNP